MRNPEDRGTRLIKCLALAALVCIALNVAAAPRTHFVAQQSKKPTPSQANTSQQAEKRSQPTVVAPQQADRASQPEPVAQPSPNCEEVEQLRKNLQELKVQVRQLRRKVTEIEKDRQVNVLRDVLSREEQRAETLQIRLRETLEKQIALQNRLQQVDQDLRPEAIERMFVGVGMVRPEEARETVRRRLSAERQGIQAQLDLLRQERARLTASLASADAAIQRLRSRIAETARP
jgi:chromosome segregation ATPase